MSDLRQKRQRMCPKVVGGRNINSALHHKPPAPEGSIRDCETGLIHFVCFTPISFKRHNLPQIRHVQTVEDGVADP